MNRKTSDNGAHSAEYGNVPIPEISYSELQLEKVSGRGCFGVVSKAFWRGKTVAVKSYTSAHQKKDFQDELRQLSRVNHPNIVALFGACSKNKTCLVMEYAEGGSLNEVLHERSDVEYHLSHVINWALQSARGIAYLHLMKPKPMMHRDLKPSNFLLFDLGRVIKLCDFGTVRTADTEMTNQKGSVAWMAPEVFQTSSYTERCDLYSWAVTLWEMLSRFRPFEDISGPAVRVLWEVSKGVRPPPLRNCPKILTDLMTSCWHKDPIVRPTMALVEGVLQKLFDIYVKPGIPNRNIHLPTLLMLPKYHNEPQVVYSAGYETLAPAKETIMRRNNCTLPTNSATPNFSGPPDTGYFSSETHSNHLIPGPVNVTHTDEAPQKNDAYLSFDELELQPTSLHPIESNEPPPPVSSDWNVDARNDAEKESEYFDRLDIFHHHNDMKMVQPILRPIFPDECFSESKKLYECHRDHALRYMRLYIEFESLRENRNQPSRVKLNQLPEERMRELRQEEMKLNSMRANMKSELDLIRNSVSNSEMISMLSKV